MAIKNEFTISSLQPPVQSKVSSLVGKAKELENGAEGISHEISNYFDELVAKKNSQRFVFNWNPSEKFKSTFTSIKKNPKSKEKPKTFKLALTARLLEDGKLVWSRRLDLRTLGLKTRGLTPALVVN